MRLQDLTNDELILLGFTGKKSGIEFVKTRILNYKKLQLPEVIILLRELKARDNEIIKNKLKLINAARWPVGREKMLEKIFLGKETKYRPKYIQIQNRNIWKQSNPPEVTSEEMGDILTKIGENNCFNKTVFSIKEEKLFYKTIKTILSDLNQLHLFKKINFHIQPLLYSKELEFHYAINGSYEDYGNYLKTKFTIEAPTVVDTTGKNLSCLLACIVHHCGKFLRKKKLLKLYEYNKSSISISDVENIAKELGLSLRLYDIEGKLWKIFDYTSPTRRSNTNLACIMIINEHAVCIKGVFKTSDFIKEIKSEECVKNIDLENVNDPLTKQILSSNMKYDTFTFNENILLCGINKNNLNTVKKGIYYTENIDVNLMEVIEFLSKNNLFPMIISSRSAIISINFKINSQEIQLRNCEFKHKYINDIPHNYNYTINSIGLYLFKTFMKEPLLKLTEPVTNTIFKNLCVPSVWIDQIILKQTFVYCIDINKAYRSDCKNIGIFTKQPKIMLIKSKLTIPVTPGIYMVNDKWIIHEMLDYLLLTEKVKVQYAIYYDITTNIIDDFATKLYNKEYCITEEDMKKTFNSLIGKFNPRNSEQAYTIIIRSEMDLSRFILSGDKNIISLYKADNVWIIQFTYDKLTYNGPNMPHISAQIIQRCKLKILKIKDLLIKQNPEIKIIGTMTDSLIFATPQTANLENIQISDKFGDFSLTKSDSIIAVGIGQYALYNTSDPLAKSIILKIQGISDPDKRNKEMLLTLISELSKERKLKKLEKYENKTNTHQHEIYIGEAGVGKSRFINESYKNVNEYLKLSPTGVSAFSIKARTLHSFFNLPVDYDNPKLPKGNGKAKRIAESYGIDKAVITSINSMALSKKIILKNIKTIVIDECYMVNNDDMNYINEILKIVCCSIVDFGDKKLILIGDNKQLTCVGKPFMESDLFYALKIKENVIPYNISNNPRLTPEYREICNVLRTDRNAEFLKNFIRDFNGSKTPLGDFSVFYRNVDANKYNVTKLSELPGELLTFNRKEFKINQKIMITKNLNLVKGIFNGQHAKLLKYDKECLSFEYVIDGITKVHNEYPKSKPNNNEVEIEETEEKENDEFNEIDNSRKYHCTNFCSAYGCTIHKVQGLTLNEINIYINENILWTKDATRLLYVALTRVKTNENVYLKLI